MNCVRECKKTDILIDDFDVRDVHKIDKKLIDQIESHYSRLDRKIEVRIDSSKIDEKLQSPQESMLILKTQEWI